LIDSAAPGCGNSGHEKEEGEYAVIELMRTLQSASLPTKRRCARLKLKKIFNEKESV
jgi:hypothetical protein